MKFRASLACFVCFALLLCCIGPDHDVQAQTDWTKYPGNPVLLHGAIGSWEQVILYACLLPEMAGYKMWYTAVDYTAGPFPIYRIGLATSPDETAFTRFPANPVLDKGPPGSWDVDGVGMPSVLFDGVGYKMWFFGIDFAGPSTGIGYATSSDGVTWSKNPGNPVLNPSPGQWDELVMTTRVLFAEGEYKMWYTGMDASTNGRIGYATSLDGLAWFKHPGNPVLDVGGAGGWDEATVGIPSVIFNGTGYEMWYAGQDASGVFRIGYATSPDGIAWTPYPSNPILEPTPGTWDEFWVSGPFTIFDGLSYHMWYSGFHPSGSSGIGYAHEPVNLPSVLTSGEASPSSGPRNGKFTYNVTYSDEDNDPAAYVRVWINKSTPFDSSPYDLKFESWKGTPGDWIAGANYSLSVNLYLEGSDYTFAFSASDGKDTVFLSEQAGPEVTALFGVEKIVFHSSRTGNWDIWKMDADGSDLVQLTTVSFEDRFPGWSPDAERITYANWNGTDYDVWVMDADGNNKTQLTTHPSNDTYPAWSPDGTRIAFTSSRDGGDPDIWVMDPDGTNKVQLTTNVSEDKQPTWSPDGSRIAFASDRTGRNIWVMDADGSNQREVQSDGGWDVWPAWSPDGTRIALTADRIDEGYDIWTMDPDGGNDTQLTAILGQDSCPCWSPDGSKIAWNSVWSGYMKIWIMDRDGSNKTQLTGGTTIGDIDACPRMTIVPDDTPPLPPVLQRAILVGGSHEDVSITWNASADEGQGGGTVMYEVWRGTDYAGPYLYLDEVVADGSPSYTYVDSGAGHGDPSNYFYRIHSVDEMAKWNATDEAAGKFVRQLSGGVNFISVPLTQADESLEAVLQTLMFDRAWFYDPAGEEWRYYARQRPYKTDLDRVDHAVGLWVNVTVGSALTVAGMVPANTTIQLLSGWNLVGFPSFNLTYTVADLKADVGATRVEGFYAPGLPYCLRLLEDFDVLQAGYAYWVRVEADIVWTVPLA